MDAIADALELGVVVAAAVVAGVSLRRLILPGARGTTAGIAATVAGTTVVVLVAQLLGLAGAFALVSVLVVLVVVAGGCAVLARRAPHAGDRAGEDPIHPASPGSRRIERTVLAGIGGLVTVQWLSALVPTLRRGILEADSLHYHLPRAARMAQTGEVLTVHHVGAGHPAAYYPGNDEVLRGVTMLPGGSELPGLALNLAAVALLLVAAWVVGARWGRPAATTAVTAVLLASPAYGAGYAGWAHNDWTALAFVAAAVALLLTDTLADDASVGPAAMVGLALGLALGTKLTVLPVVVAVGLAAVLLAPRARRVATGGVVAGAALLAGGSWYLRNLLVLGTPAPGLPLLPGPAGLLPEDAYTVASYLDDPAVVRDWFVPGLVAVLGPLWPVVLVAAVVGVVLALRGPDPVLRVLGAVALLGLVAYLLTPTGAVGPPGRPVLFGSNLRYAWPGLLFALWGLAVVLPRRVVVPGAAVLVAVALSSAAAFGPGSTAWLVAGWAAAAVAAAAAWLAVGGRPVPVPARVGRAVGGIVAVAGVLLLAGPLVPGYEARRYDAATDRLEAHRVLFRAAQDLADARVAVSGWPMNYPLFGPGLVNDVVHLGVQDDDGAYVPPASCGAFRDALAAGGFDTVAVFARPGGPRPAEEAWLDDPGATTLATSPAGSIVRLLGELSPTGCPVVGEG